MKNWKLAVGAAALMAAFSAHAETVDLFTTAQPQTPEEDRINGGIDEASSIYSQVGSAADTTILGRFRDLWVTAISGATGDLPEPGTQGSSLSVEGGMLVFANDPGVVGVGEIQWDGDDDEIGTNPIYDINYTGLYVDGVGYDLTDGDTLSAFELTSIFSDLDWVFEITMYTDEDNWTKVSLDATAVGVPNGLDSPHVSLIPFSAFTDYCPPDTYLGAQGVNLISCAGVGADPGNVGALVVRLNTGDSIAGVAATAAIDLQLTSVTTVPEPGTIALIGMGLLAAGFAGRRNSAKG